MITTFHCEFLCHRKRTGFIFETLPLHNAINFATLSYHIKDTSVNWCSHLLSFHNIGYLHWASIVDLSKISHFNKLPCKKSILISVPWRFHNLLRIIDKTTRSVSLEHVGEYFFEYRKYWSTFSFIIIVGGVKFWWSFIGKHDMWFKWWWCIINFARISDTLIFIFSWLKSAHMGFMGFVLLWL